MSYLRATDEASLPPPELENTPLYLIPVLKIIPQRSPTFFPESVGLIVSKCIEQVGAFQRCTEPTISAYPGDHSASVESSQ